MPSNGEQKQLILYDRESISADICVCVSEIVRAMTHVINHGMSMYWGTSRWSAMEIMVSGDDRFLRTLSFLIQVSNGHKNYIIQ